VVGKAAQRAWRAAPRVACEGESGRQCASALLEAIDAEEFAVQGAGVEADQTGARPARRILVGARRRDPGLWQKPTVLSVSRAGITRSRWAS
jgi:hypothetical protein